MEGKYALHVFPLAQADFESIFRYISEELCNPGAAAKLIDDMQVSLDLVCENPCRCPLVNNRLVKDPTIRKLIVRNYLVFYRVSDDRREIQVIRVLYHMMKYDHLL